MQRTKTQGFGGYQRFRLTKTDRGRFACAFAYQQDSKMLRVRACFVQFNKVILAVVNIFVVIIGLATFVLGVWSKAAEVAYIDIVSSTAFDIPIVLIIFGLVVVAVGVVGFIATICAHHIISKIILFVYAAFLIVIVIVEISGVIAAFVQQTRIRDTFESAAKNNFMGINVSNKRFRTWNNVQQKLSCCGVNNYTDWYTVTWNTSCNSSAPFNKCVPQSCCTGFAVANKSCTVMATDPERAYFNVGCAGQIADAVSSYIAAVAGVAIFIALALIVVIVITCIVTFCKQKSNSYSRFDEPEK